METFLTDLDLLLTNRKEQKKSGSYTSSLFEAGTDRL